MWDVHDLFLVNHSGFYIKASPLAAGPTGMPLPGSGGVSFDRFVRACVTVKQLTEQYERLSGGNRHADIKLNYEQFMGVILSTP